MRHTFPPSRSARRAAFTLVELLVVIGIIAVLISVLLPTLNTARQQARQVKCAAAMREVGQAIAIFAGENRNRFPSRGTTEAGDYVPWQVVLNMVVYKQPNDLNGGPIQTRNYVGSGGAAISAQYGPGNKRLVCPETGREGPNVRYWNMNVYAAGGASPAYVAGIKISHPLFGQGLQLGAQRTRFRDPARKFLVIESGTASGEVSYARLTDRADPAAATPRVPFSAPEKIYAFRHRGLSANVLWVDGHVSLVRHSDKLNITARTHWSFNNETGAVPTR